ncbi:MAG: hypothetical protein EA397_00295 [Deltaproteobacteria bacterium]|nr:MAG: hypothetical protein EA397_00295 [Deltaproteobacteria bacterium]
MPTTRLALLALLAPLPALALEDDPDHFPVEAPVEVRELPARAPPSEEPVRTREELRGVSTEEEVIVDTSDPRPLPLALPIDEAPTRAAPAPLPLATQAHEEPPAPSEPSEAVRAEIAEALASTPGSKADDPDPLPLRAPAPETTPDDPDPLPLRAQAPETTSDDPDPLPLRAQGPEQAEAPPSPLVLAESEVAPPLPVTTHSPAPPAPPPVAASSVGTGADPSAPDRVSPDPFGIFDEASPAAAPQSASRAEAPARPSPTASSRSESSLAYLFERTEAAPERTETPPERTSTGSTSRTTPTTPSPQARTRAPVLSQGRSPAHAIASARASIADARAAMEDLQGSIRSEMETLRREMNGSLALAGGAPPPPQVMPQERRTAPIQPSRVGPPPPRSAPPPPRAAPRAAPPPGLGAPPRSLPPYDPCLDEGQCEEELRRAGLFVGGQADFTTLGSGAARTYAGEVGGHLGRAFTLSLVAGHTQSLETSSDLGFIGLRPGVSLTPDQTFSVSGDLLLGIGAPTHQLGTDALQPINLYEPRLGLGVRLGSWGRLQGHAGFRHIPATHPGAAELTGPTVGVGLRIGAF